VHKAASGDRFDVAGSVRPHTGGGAQTNIAPFIPIRFGTFKHNSATLQDQTEEKESVATNGEEGCR